MDILLERITVNPAIMVGKPTIRGTRLTIEHLLKAMAGGLTFDDLKEDYPFLEQADLQAIGIEKAEIVQMPLEKVMGIIASHFPTETNDIS